MPIDGPSRSAPAPGVIVLPADRPAYGAVKGAGIIDAPVAKKIEKGDLPTDISPDAIYSSRLASEPTSALRGISPATSAKLAAIGVPNVLALSRVSEAVIRKADLKSKVQADVLRASELLKVSNPYAHSVPVVKSAEYTDGAANRPGPMHAMTVRGPAIAATVQFDQIKITPQSEISISGKTVTLKLWGTSPRGQIVAGVAAEPQQIRTSVLGLDLKAGATYKLRVVGEDNQLLTKVSSFKFDGV